MKRAYSTMLPSFMQNHAGPKTSARRQGKKAPDRALEDEKNRRWTELYVGYLASHQKQAPDRGRR
jgi:hypothetical protein